LLQLLIEIDNIATVKKSCSTMGLIISATQLRTMLATKDLLLVDTRSFASYSESHIPGAVNIDLMQFHWIDTSRTGIEQFNRQMRLLLSNIGVSNEKFVVFYDDVSGPSAARGVWLLLYFSHEKVAMLDGGFNSWKSSGLRIETRTNPFVHTKFKGRLNPKVLADLKRVRLAGKSKRAFIIDARSVAEYDGSAARAAKVGHIQGAINIDWANNLAGDVMKSETILKRIYARIPKATEVITYCQGGYRAANTFVVLKELGYENVRMYLGSWGEWGNTPDAPVISK
jgi:thiosulfate/3-mercaptopyruvate sulfurtransferase